ncbi:MAG: alpha-N-arabinofuranosidase [Treponema sp.]|nr:alpha-N-arabinofuranosidase [Treponema sp.]
MKKLSLVINAKDKIGHINPEIYSHFSEHLGRCVYDGIFVGKDSKIPNIDGIRKDIIDAFKQIKVPAVRWPGGAFADEYHWKDGIGPLENRKKITNTNWGGIIEDNSFGTHEFMRFCELVGCEPYINGNVGSGTVQEMSEWVEYMTSDGQSPMADLRRANGQEKPWKVKFLGIGNESWGCGGNMRPEYYADEYKRFQTYTKNHSGNQLYKIACGPNSFDLNWMEVMMKNLNPGMVNGIDQHYYTMPVWPQMESATDFDDDVYYKTISSANFINTIITRDCEIMNRYDPEKKIGLIIGEWGCWHAVEEETNPAFLYQQNTMRDALVAAIHLNIFNSHSDRLVMANLAQMVNVLQAIILTKDEKLIKTPTYHVFDLFKEHQNGDALYCYSENQNMREGLDTPLLSSSASIKDGVLTITLANTSLDQDVEICGDLIHFNGTAAKARILKNEVHAYNDFDNSDKVKIEDYKAELENGKLKLILPACSVVEVRLSK